MSTPANPLTPQQPPAPQGVFGKIGLVLPGIANRLAAAFGNYRPLQEEQRQQQLTNQTNLANSTLADQSLNRQHLKQQIDNFQTPDQIAERQIRVKHAETPTTYQTDEGQTGIADTDLQGVTKPRNVAVPNPEIRMAQQRTNDFNQNFPGGQVATPPPPLPPTIQRPATMPPQVGFHLTGNDESGNPIVSLYNKGGAPMGSAPAPAKPDATLIPGMGKVGAIDAGAANALPPDPRTYPQGAKDPKFRADYQTFLKSAADAKQANALAAAGARGAAFNSSKPITTLDETGQDVISTLGDERRAGRGKPGNPILAGNQSGAAGLGQKRATFAEVDKNLANVRQYLPALTSDYADRAAFAAALTPGTGMVSNISEAAGLKHLNPDQQNLIFAIRNLRQGATSLKNVLSSSGVSDKRVAILESELPNEADLLTGDPSTVDRKLQTFESVYRELIQAYPQIMSGGNSPRGQLNGPTPMRSAPASPVLPPVPSANRVIRYDAQGNRIQ